MSTTSNTSSPFLAVLGSFLMHAVIVVVVMSPLIVANQPTPIQTKLLQQADLQAAQQALLQHHRAQKSQTANASRADKQAAQQDFYQQSRRDEALLQHWQHEQTANRTTKQAQNRQSDAPYRTPPSQAVAQSNADSASDSTSVDTNDINNANQTANDSTHAIQAFGGENSPKPDANQARQAIEARISANWVQYRNASNQMVKFTVHIDDAGQVTNIEFIAGHPALHDSAKAAVYAAAPFRELVGIRKSFVMQLTTLQEME